MLQYECLDYLIAIDSKVDLMAVGIGIAVIVFSGCLLAIAIIVAKNKMENGNIHMSSAQIGNNNPHL